MHGNSAEVQKRPTLTTSIAKTHAAIGVPNTAANTPLIPHMVRMWRSSSFKRNSLPKNVATLPPIWSAAPSRPAEPPSRCVIVVPRKMAGASKMETPLLLRTPSNTSFVPHAGKRGKVYKRPQWLNRRRQQI